eukprot:COSAG02_NODE_64451_length_260_cov_0.956522_1_plen_39_part_01
MPTEAQRLARIGASEFYSAQIDAFANSDRQMGGGARTGD